MKDVRERSGKNGPQVLRAIENRRARHEQAPGPNVGKSTLINALVGEARVIALDAPGTTRDAIEVPFERDGRSYTLIDTAGIRKRSRQGEAIERFSIVKTLQAIEAANVAVLLLDAAEGISEQDAHVAGYLLERGRAVVVGVNKWDAADEDMRRRVRDELRWKLGFLDFAEVHMIFTHDLVVNVFFNEYFI